MKKALSAAVLIALLLLLGGCAESGEIVTVTREDGSGTRSAFSELFGVIGEDGEDSISEKAEVTNSTSVMLYSVQGCRAAIGYASSGVVRGEVKVLKIDGVSPSESTIKSGEYTVVREFLTVTGSGAELSPAAEDFLSYLSSREASVIITELGYVPSEEATEYSAKSLSGRIIIAGSTSVSPVIEACGEAYRILNPGVVIELQQTGSSAGLLSLSEGICDIALSSRALTDGEKETMTARVLAYDGIAVIVNPDNPLNDITKADIKKIFEGSVTSWSEIDGGVE